MRPTDCLVPQTELSAWKVAVSTPKIYALHENPEWFPPFADAFAAEGVEYVEWVLTDGVLDLDEAPPEGIFWSRISASSHTRDHGLTKDYSRAVLSWLEASGRRTVNGRCAPPGSTRPAPWPPSGVSRC